MYYVIVPFWVKMGRHGFVFFNTTPYTLAGFDLIASISTVAGGDDTTT
jgi:hypothetical protein